MFSKFTSLVTAAASAALIITLSGCGGDSSDSGDTGSEAAAPATDSGSAGSGLSGKISFEGTPPERTAIDTEGDPKCAMMHADAPLLSDKVLVDASGGLANVFLYIDNPPEADYAAPETPVVLDQVGCQYTPHVLGVQAGQPLEVHNSDDTLHNVRAVARKNKPVNMAQPAGSKPRMKTFKVAEASIRVKCDIHRWMTAYVFSMDHPFFAVSDDTGAFSIAGLPAGEYTVNAWHESLGEQTGTVTIAEDGSGTIDFSFSE